MLKKSWTRLANADPERQDDRVEVGQDIGELPRKLLGMQLVGVASEQQAVMGFQFWNQNAYVRVGRKNICPRARQEIFRAV